MTEVRIYMHPAHLGTQSSTDIELAMRLIGLAFGDPDSWPEKYGAEVENDVFLMKPYCWCEKEGECPWCTGCGAYEEVCEACSATYPCGADKARAHAIEIKGCDYRFGRGIFARFAPWTLDDQRHYYDPPNFWYKPANFRLTWYKYIGRDMTANADYIASDFLARVFETHPKKMSMADAAELLWRRSDERDAEFSAMLASLNIQRSS